MLKKKSSLTVIAILTGVFMFIKLVPSPDKTLEELAPLYLNSSSKFMSIDGYNIHYRDEGEGFPIILIHGTGSSLHTWEEWTKELIKHYRVIRLDLPAYGLTGEDAQKRYSSIDYVNLLDVFLNELEIETFHLGGNSLGGLVAWLYTSYHDAKVNKLFLLDPSGFPFDSTPMIIRLAKTPVLNLFARYITPKVFIEKNLKEVYYDDRLITEATINRYRDLTLYKGNRQAFIDRAYIERENHLDRLKYIATPTLILWGENDAWIPVTDAYKFDKALTNSKVHIMSNTGHVPMEERPIESVKIVREFIEN